MENNNVHFNLDELLLIGDESICGYSGLPSVSSYTTEPIEEESDYFYSGHS
jgi:hypothetical protein